MLQYNAEQRGLNANSPISTAERVAGEHGSSILQMLLSLRRVILKYLYLTLDSIAPNFKRESLHSRFVNSMCNSYFTRSRRFPVRQ